MLKETQALEFTEEQVLDAWSAYSQKRIKEGASDTEQLLFHRKMEKSGEHNVRLILESQLEVSILEKTEGEIVRFFRSALQNSLLQLEKVVTEQETSRNLYTSKEKFEYMANQNPALRMMKERLGLDFEY